MTNNVKHTPGPWAIYEGYDATVIRTTVRKECQITPRSVAEATHHGEYYERNGERTAYQQATAEDRANARLIAAAPELLAEITNLVEICETHCPHIVNKRDINRARAAIAKAEGK